MHPLFEKADKLSYSVIGAAIEVHRLKGAGLLESIYEKCLLRELELRGIAAINQRQVQIEYKGLVFEEPLQFDVLAEDCLLVAAKSRAGNPAHPQGAIVQLYEGAKPAFGPHHQLSRIETGGWHQPHDLAWGEPVSFVGKGN